MPIDTYEDDEEEQEGPKSSFATYLAEGDTLFKQSEFTKALDSYTLALELQPNDKTCLVARSKCHLKLGDPQKALIDAEAALSEDKEYNKGLYRKAEALYCMGDFEYALMYYHRGHKLRPELDEFRLGIQKAQEAIDNSIGSTAKIKLENKGDLSFFTKHDDMNNKKRGANKPLRNTMKVKPVITNRNKEVKQPAPSKKTVKQLLGELYADKEYLEKLMEDTDFIQSNVNKPIYELVQGGITYLDTRTEFWRQQKPLYARKKDTGKSASSKKKKVKPSMSKYVLKELEEIDQALISGNPERSLKLAQQLLKKVDESTLHDLPNKNDVLSNIHSSIGNAFVEMDLLNKALKHHQKDMEISKKSQSTEGISRALDNIGRVYARMGKYEKAVKSWTDKLPLVKTPLENTWLSHEIGRCYLELGDYPRAEEFGEKSFEAGEECGDEVWQLNALVLAAQAQAKLGKLKSALNSFERAHGIAVSLEDESAQAAIIKATEELQRKIEEDTGKNAEEIDDSGSDAEANYISENKTRNAESDNEKSDIGDRNDSQQKSIISDKDNAEVISARLTDNNESDSDNKDVKQKTDDDTTYDISTHDDAFPSNSEDTSHEKLDSFYDTTHTDSDGDNASTQDAQDIEIDSQHGDQEDDYTPVPSDNDDDDTPRKESETPPVDENESILKKNESSPVPIIADEKTSNSISNEEIPQLSESQETVGDNSSDNFLQNSPNEVDVNKEDTDKQEPDSDTTRANSDEKDSEKDSEQADEGSTRTSEQNNSDTSKKHSATSETSEIAPVLENKESSLVQIVDDEKTSNSVINQETSQLSESRESKEEEGNANDDNLVESSSHNEVDESKDTNEPDMEAQKVSSPSGLTHTHDDKDRDSIQDNKKDLQNTDEKNDGIPASNDMDTQREEPKSPASSEHDKSDSALEKKQTPPPTTEETTSNSTTNEDSPQVSESRASIQIEGNTNADHVEQSSSQVKVVENEDESEVIMLQKKQSSPTVSVETTPKEVTNGEVPKYSDSEETTPNEEANGKTSQSSDSAEKTTPNEATNGEVPKHSDSEKTTPNEVTNGEVPQSSSDSENTTPNDATNRKVSPPSDLENTTPTEQTNEEIPKPSDSEESQIMDSNNDTDNLVPNISKTEVVEKTDTTEGKTDIEENTTVVKT